MAGVPAGAQVRAGEAAERELRAIGAAADGQHARLDAQVLVGLDGRLHELRILAHDLGHVAVLLLDRHLDALALEPRVQELGRMLHQVELCLEALGVVVAHDVAHRGVRDGARDALQVDKAVVAVGVLGAHVRRQHPVEVGRDVQRVDHAVLGGAGVDRVALDAHGHVGRVEALPLQLADSAAVYGVGVLAPKGVDIEQRRPVADLLVGAKADAQARMRQLGVLVQARNERHDHGDACLVVAAQQRGAVGDHDVLAYKAVEFGEHVRPDGDLAPVHDAADQVSALIMHDVRLHAKTGSGLGGVEMRQKAQTGLVLGARARGDMRHHVAVLGHGRVSGAQAPQLLGQQVGQVELAGA